MVAISTPKTIVITGSTRGIGYAMARLFLEQGHRVVINGRLPGSVAIAVDNLRQISPSVIGTSGNVAEAQTMRSIVDTCLQAFGAIDIWINNAGIPQPRNYFTAIDENVVREVIATNLTGTMLGCQAAISQMQLQAYGKIFNMEGFGSDGRMMPKLCLYGTTKRAVRYFSRSLARELAGSPVQLGTISPGMVRTDFLKGSLDSGSPEEQKRFRKVYAMLAEDVDIVAAFLVENILKSKKSNDHIAFLRGPKLMFRLIKMMLS